MLSFVSDSFPSAQVKLILSSNRVFRVALCSILDVCYSIVIILTNRWYRYFQRGTIKIRCLQMTLNSEFSCGGGSYRRTCDHMKQNLKVERKGALYKWWKQDLNLFFEDGILYCVVPFLYLLSYNMIEWQVHIFLSLAMI